MKGNLYALCLLLSAAPLTGYAAEQLVPAGSLIQCTVSEPRLSSKTEAIGDPVLCQVSHVELYGRSVFPYGSYLVGRFEDYKDPGHFVGKGWMELKFDRMVVPPDTILPVEAKVVYVPNYPVDREGRIHGKGHPVRDSIEWAIPVLWPIDLINLPRRGPRPVLKEETRLTLKVMNDFGVPIYDESPRDQYGFSHRTPMAYAQPEASPMPPARMSDEYAPPPPPPTTITYGEIAPPPAPAYAYPAPAYAAPVYVPVGYVTPEYIVPGYVAPYRYVYMAPPPPAPVWRAAAPVVMVRSGPPYAVIAP